MRLRYKRDFERTALPAKIASLNRTAEEEKEPNSRLKSNIVLAWPPEIRCGKGGLAQRFAQFCGEGSIEIGQL